jgi:phosphatidylserine/phosphatidylglycerophosphate/cardiolipin synthase-like enzyme
LELAEKVEIDLEDYKRLRSKVFDLAKSQGLHGFDWLEDAMKILDKAKEITYSSHAFFSPEDSGQEDLEQLLLSAHKAIWVCVFTISDDKLAKALIHKHKQGLDVKVVTDNDKMYDRGSDVFEMKEAGIPVKIDDTRHHMHHKFAIVDKEILVNGSYNWTRSADEYNHENLIITKDEALVKDFTQEFKKLWESMHKL